MIPATKFAPFLVIAVLGLYSCDIRVAAMPPDLRSNMRAEMGQSTTERSLDTADSFQNQSNVEDFIGVTNLPKRKIYSESRLLYVCQSLVGVLMACRFVLIILLLLCPCHISSGFKNIKFVRLFCVR